MMMQENESDYENEFVKPQTMQKNKTNITLEVETRLNIHFRHKNGKKLKLFIHTNNSASSC